MIVEGVALVVAAAAGAGGKIAYDYWRTPTPNPEAVAAGEPPHLHKCYVRVVNGEEFHTRCAEFPPFDRADRAFPPKAVVKDTAHWIHTA